VAMLSVVPVSHIADRSLADALRDGGRTGTGGRARSRRALVVAEIALSLVLLVGALLLTRSFARMQRTDPGFDAAGVLTLRVSLPETRYPNDSALAQFHNRLHTQLRALPGVQSSASVLTLPLSAQNTFTAITIEDHPLPPGRAIAAHRESITPEYFSVLRIPI